MPIQLDVQGGRITRGDTKALRITPEDITGSAVTPSKLDVEVTQPNGSVTYGLADFEQDGNDLVLFIDFPDVGNYEIVVEGAGQQAVNETVADSVYAYKRDK